MKKNILLFIFTFSVLVSHAQYAWKQKADYPGDGRSAASGFSFSDFGYIGLGYDGEDFRRSFYAYDPLYDVWQQTESLGGAIGEGLERNLAASFTIGNYGYIATGQGTDPYLNDFWKYNYTTNIWTAMPNVGGIDRRGAVGFAVNGKGYVALGQDVSGYRRDLWQFDTLTNAWTQKADYVGTARRFAASFVVDNRIFVGTGDDGAFTKDFYEYNAFTNSWIVRPDFPGSPRYSATGFAVNGKGYFMCGYDTTLANRNDFWEYDPLINAWTQLEDFPGGARANATAFVVDTLAFIGMGYDTSFLYDIWLWGDTSEIIKPDTTDTTDAIFDIYSGLSDLLIAPNPVYGNTSITVQTNSHLNALRVRIIDLNGRDVTALCAIETPMYENGNYRFNLNTLTLPAGNYQCIVFDNRIIGVENFIVL